MLYCRIYGEFASEELAELTGVSASTIGNYENNITVPNIQRLSDISRALDVTISMVMHGREPEQEYDPLIPD